MFCCTDFIILVIRLWINSTKNIIYLPATSLLGSDLVSKKELKEKYSDVSVIELICISPVKIKHLQWLAHFETLLIYIFLHSNYEKNISDI